MLKAGYRTSKNKWLGNTSGFYGVVKCIINGKCVWCRRVGPAGQCSLTKKDALNEAQRRVDELNYQEQRDLMAVKPTEPAKPFIKPVKYKVAFDGGEYDSGAAVNGALQLNWLSRREARAVLRGIGYDLGQAATLVRVYGHAGRDKDQQATGEDAAVLRLAVIE